jgi:peptide/nickel transport system substrate-binding protein
MRNLRYYFRLIGAILSQFKILILISIFIGIAFFFILRYILPLVSATKVIRIGTTGAYGVDNLPDSIVSMISSGLTKIDKDGSPMPDLAQSWESPDNGKTWIFTLKDNLYWQDGKRITSRDISYPFSDVTTSFPDNRTISFKLQNPYSAFPTVVSRPIFKTGLLGTGQWRVTNIILNGSIVEQLTLRNKRGEQIIYKFYPTEESAKVAFELGQVDELTNIFIPSPLNTWQRIKITKDINTHEYVAVFFNTQDKLLNEKNLRQALAYAINKDSLDDGMRAISPISIDSWAYNPQVKTYDYDPNKAKSMIDTYKKSSKINEINITLSTPSLLLSQAESIQKDWQAVGINVSLQVVTGVPTDYQAFLAVFDIPEDPDQYTIWHSTQVLTNITHYQNPRIDLLLENGRTEVNTNDRKQTYMDFQRFLVEDSPAAFLYYPAIYTISRR